MNLKIIENKDFNLYAELQIAACYKVTIFIYMSVSMLRADDNRA